jgi:hypothetical protein
MEQQYLKSKKASKIMHKKELLTYSFAFILIMALINMVSADTTQLQIASTGVQFFQEKRMLADNLTMENYGTLAWGNPSPYDTISKGKSYDSYVWYHGNIGDWNTKFAGTDNIVDYCTLTIKWSDNTNSSLVTLFSKNFTSNIDDGKYFVQLNQHEAYYVYNDCKFKTTTGRTNANLVMPMDFEIVTPTYNCKSCQVYEWQQDQIRLTVATRLGDYTSKNTGYISGLFKIFYEIAIYGFWVFLILLLILAVSLIFYSIYWVYSYLSKQARNI